VPLGGHPRNVARRHFERGVERERAVSVILEPVALSTARRQRQHPVESVECLDRRLLIDTQHDGVLRRVEIEPDDVGSLRLEHRVGADDVALEPVGLEPSPLPDPEHGRGTHADARGEARCGPVRERRGRRDLFRQLQECDTAARLPT